MNGTEKQIDKLGRLLIPAEFRKKLGLEKDSKVLVALEGNMIFITPTEKCCTICGSKVQIHKDFHLCAACIKKIKRSTI